MKKTTAQTSRSIAFAIALGLTAGLGACGATITKHGHHLRPTDLQQIQPGMAEDEVRMALGSPATTSQTANGKSYYYISSTTQQQAFFKPKEVDRKVIAVYFSPLGSVTRVANYGLKDGRVFDYISRETPSANTADETILQQLFRNLGRRTLTAG
ncbi:MAG: outer membrane protein assembly factor BamE [Pseudomonadota bacterium]